MAIEQQKPNCQCGGVMDIIDCSESSVTAICQKCRHASLVVNHSEFSACIPLCDFHLKRGDRPGDRPLDDVKMARDLYGDLLRNQWPSPVVTLEYGIDDSSHFKALQFAIRAGVTPYDLDRVEEDGPAITQLVRSVPGQPFEFVVFRTIWDGAFNLILGG